MDDRYARDIVTSLAGIAKELKQISKSLGIIALDIEKKNEMNNNIISKTASVTYYTEKGL